MVLFLTGFCMALFRLAFLGDDELSDVVVLGGEGAGERHGDL